MNSFDWQKEPLNHFLELYQKAEKVVTKDPNAMVLSTTGLHNRPRSRVVLYKGIHNGCLCFYTNYEGSKGQEIAHSPFASLNFYWSQLDIQIRIEGKLEKLSREDSEKYFSTRPRLSQIGAWASTQSEVIPDQKFLQEKVKFFEHKFHQTEVIPCPPHWGGYKMQADYYEFWFAHEGRLHERYIYQKQASGLWHKSQKSP